ncbi:unnamed protein product [Gulo gulo]|uniref:Uncharacterized protein n=1 Tax=Gulo gulo TaxID=48420 RepID=A0A9X9M158_GULGU|nr:unnamed protein product [Gulo gulo]
MGRTEAAMSRLAGTDLAPGRLGGWPSRSSFTRDPSHGCRTLTCSTSSGKLKSKSLSISFIPKARWMAKPGLTPVGGHSLAVALCCPFVLWLGLLCPENSPVGPVRGADGVSMLSREMRGGPGRKSPISTEKR